MTTPPPPDRPPGSFLPPVLPRQEVLAPRPRRPHFYDGYKWWHWALLVVCVAVLAVIFFPFYLGVLQSWG